MSYEEIMDDAARSTVNMVRRKNRNTNMVWFLTKILHWYQVDVSVDAIKRAGGTIAYYGDARMTIDDIFASIDEGIRTMKMWCQCQSRKKWRYEPGQSFFFQRKEDAALFKLRWC